MVKNLRKNPQDYKKTHTHTKYAHPYISSQRKNRELRNKRSKNIHSIPNTVEMICNTK